MGIGNYTMQLGGKQKESRSGETDGELSRNDVFEVLRNERRRLTLEYLERTEEERVPLKDVVDYVTSRENDTPVEEIDSGKRKAVYTALRQSHFPKMNDLGVVEYDNLRGEVELTPAAKDVQMYLEYVPENEIPWHEYYVGLTAVSAALLVVTYLGAFPFDRLSWQALATLFVVLFGVSAAAHTYYSRENRIDLENPL